MKIKLGFRLAAVLLVLVMVSSCFVGSTFAKYTTSSTGTDNARVAYWGFQSSGSIMFALQDFESTESIGNFDGSLSDIFMPGKSRCIQFAFEYGSNFSTGSQIYAPEVDYFFCVDAEVTGNYALLDKNPNFKWALYNGAVGERVYYDTVDELVYALEALDGSASGAAEYKAGQNPIQTRYYLYWLWEYETEGEGMDAQDKLDTEMGNMQDLEDVAFTITITATQID